jgi:hypothetical protein
MPDLRGMTETAARAALLAAGISDATTVTLFGAQDDADHLGETGYASTITADGTISFQMPPPGSVYEDFEGSLTFNLWGADPTDSLIVRIADWVQTFENTFYALGTAPTWTVHLTTLFKEGEYPSILSIITQYSDLSVTRVKNGISTASITISQFDPAATYCVPFAFALKLYYRGELVFWAPANAEDDFGEGTVTLTSGDIQILEHHYIRIGDPILDITDPDTGLTDEGFITRDGFGMEGLLECAQNLPEQDSGGWPKPGIAISNEATPTLSVVGVERGQEVLSVMSDITSQMTGPDYVMKPRDDVPDAYMEMIVSDQIFEDKHLDIIWTYNVTGQPDNLAGISVHPQFPNSVVHVLDQPPLHRETAVNAGAAGSVGAWVRWEATDVKVTDGDTSALQELADAIASVYGYPLHQASVELRPDAGQEHFYGWEHDFVVGDIVTIGATKGNRAFLGMCQIVEVTLSQQSWRGPPQTDLQVVPWVEGVGEGGGDFGS